MDRKPVAMKQYIGGLAAFTLHFVAFHTAQRLGIAFTMIWSLRVLFGILSVIQYFMVELQGTLTLNLDSTLYGGVAGYTYLVFQLLHLGLLLRGNRCVAAQAGDQGVKLDMLHTEER